MSHYASLAQREAMALLQAGFGSRFRTYRSTPAIQVTPGDLPMLGVYIMRESREAWGSANHAEPKFNHALTLGLSGAVHAETDKQGDLNALEDWMSEADDILLTDPHFVNLFAGVTSMDRQSQYAKVGDTTLFEIRVEMVVAFQSNFPPLIEHTFDVLHVETQFPDAAHAASGTPQITRVYDLVQKQTERRRR